MPGPPSAIEFYFDFSSPYSYFASEWIEALAARHGRTVRWKAILLGVTFQAAELKSPVHHPIKREYTLHDFERSARYAGVPYKLPDPFPIATQNAARVFWWLDEQRPEAAPAWARHCLRAYFTRNVNLADTVSLKALAGEFGLDADEAEAVWTSPSAKARLRQVCDDAVAHGVFGAPFFVVDGEPFWGNDRRAQIERWLQGGSFQATVHSDL
jgi:2-hydroxychromene-2-carboxylate isomerase